MAKKFTSLKDLEMYVQNQVLEAMSKSTELKDVTQDAMEHAVETMVYNAYTPKSYIRRKNKGGLSDRRNMTFTYHGKLGSNQIVSLFENITTGSHYSPVYFNPQDSLFGEYISETIEKGIEKNFYNPIEQDKRGRYVSTPRPFVQEGTIGNLELMSFGTNKLAEAFVKDLKKQGLNVKEKKAGENNWR